MAPPDTGVPSPSTGPSQRMGTMGLEGGCWVLCCEEASELGQKIQRKI